MLELYVVEILELKLDVVVVNNEPDMFFPEYISIPYSFNDELDIIYCLLAIYGITITSELLICLNTLITFL